MKQDSTVKHLLNQKISNLLKQHKSGEPFFNALDMMVRSEHMILDSLISFAQDILDTKLHMSRKILVMSGKFGRAVLNTQFDFVRQFDEVKLFEGGLRSIDSTDQIDTIFTFDPRCKLANNTTEILYLDDSIYSGKTLDMINRSISTEISNPKIVCVILYDGTIKKQDNTYSLYRYHKNN